MSGQSARPVLKTNEGSSQKAKVQDLDRLQCPICLELPKAEVYICPNGHSICSSCVAQMTSCPSCRAPYPAGAKQRNYFAEDFLDTVLFSCSWEEKGCKERELSRRQINDHEEHCQHNPHLVNLCHKLLPEVDCSYVVSPKFIKDLSLALPEGFRHHLSSVHNKRFENVFNGIAATTTLPPQALTKLASNSGRSVFSSRRILHLLNLDDSSDSIGYFMLFRYRQKRTSDVLLSWFVVRITDPPQSSTVTVAFTLKGHAVSSNQVSGGDLNVQTSWGGQIFSLSELNEFMNKSEKERRKLNFSIPLSHLREHYLTPEEALKIGFVFTVTPNINTV